MIAKNSCISERIGYAGITQSPGMEMDDAMKSENLDSIDSNPQSDEEIRRKLGWYLVPENSDNMNHTVDTWDD